MPGLSMNQTVSDKDIADIITFVRHAWTNRSGAIGESFIKETRSSSKAQGGVPYTEQQLK